MSVKIDKETGNRVLYPKEAFNLVVDVNLTSPVYWAIEMVGRIAEVRSSQGKKRWTPEEEVQGAVVFLGSVSSQGIKGQIAYSATKAALEGVSSCLMKESIFYGVHTGVIHPGFTDTAMVRALGDDYIQKYIVPNTQLGRLIRPDEIAAAICFKISNPTLTGELWVDAGWGKH